MWHGGAEYVFRPSFRAMSACGDAGHLEWMLGTLSNPTPATLPVALSVLSCCYTGDDDLCGLIGAYESDGPVLRYSPGAMPWENVCLLGASLLLSGAAGDPRASKELSRGARGKGGLFDPARFVAAAIAHLGIPSDQAWDMTLPDFQRAMLAKYPHASKPRHTPPEEYKATVDTIMSIRRRAGRV